MKYSLLPISLVACLLASPVYAGGAASFYIGGSVGSSEADNDGSQMDTHGLCKNAKKQQQTCVMDNKDKASHLYGGFQVTDGFAVEAGYVNMGNTADYIYSDPMHIQQETTGVTLTGVARQRLGKTSPLMVYGKAGVVRWSSETSVESDVAALHGQTVKQSGVSPTVGAGLEYEMTSNMSLHAGWDRYFNVGEDEHLLKIDNANETVELNTLETDVDVISAGINYHFL